MVVVGGYHGKGKRTAVYGAFLLACYDPDSETFQTICKIGTGFSEEILKTHAETLRELEVAKCRADVDAGGAKPDVWFEPKMVWEVLAADLSLSPIYSAAKGIVRVIAAISIWVPNRCSSPSFPFNIRWKQGVYHCASPASSVYAMTRMPTTRRVRSR